MTNEELTRVCSEISRECGVDFAAFLGRTQWPKDVAARRVASAVLHGRFGQNPHAIAQRVWGVCHKSVTDRLVSHAKLMERDADYRALYARCLSRLGLAGVEQEQEVAA